MRAALVLVPQRTLSSVSSTQLSVLPLPRPSVSLSPLDYATQKMTPRGIITGLGIASMLLCSLVDCALSAVLTLPNSPLFLQKKSMASFLDTGDLCPPCHPSLL